MTFSSSKDKKEEEKSGYSFSCLLVLFLHTPPCTQGSVSRHSLASGLAIFLKKTSHVTHLYRQQGGLIPPEVCSSAAIYYLYEITVRLQLR